MLLLLLNSSTLGQLCYCCIELLVAAPYLLQLTVDPISGHCRIKHRSIWGEERLLHPLPPCNIPGVHFLRHSGFWGGQESLHGDFSLLELSAFGGNLLEVLSPSIVRDCDDLRSGCTLS